MNAKVPKSNAVICMVSTDRFELMPKETSL